MNLAPHDLSKHLSQSIGLVYLITGDEILLVEESVHLILKKARSEGFEEHLIIEAETSQGADLFLSHRQNFSLFSSKKIIEIRFRQKIAANFAKLLIETLSHPDSNQVIILRMPKLSRAEMQLKWYKTIEQLSCVIVLWPLKDEAFLRWIKKRFEMHKMQTSEESYALIAANTEGNLLAAAQIIEKLSLIHRSTASLSTTTIPYESIRQALSDEAHYDVFELCDVMLEQKPEQCLKVLFTLKNQGTEPAIILWALMQDFRKLAALLATSAANRFGVYQKQGIWSSRQVVFQKALTAFSQMTNNHISSILQTLIQKAQCADRIIKGAQSGNVWEIFQDICLIISSPRLYQHFKTISL